MFLNIRKKIDEGKVQEVFINKVGGRYSEMEANGKYGFILQTFVVGNLLKFAE